MWVHHYLIHKAITCIINYMYLFTTYHMYFSCSCLHWYCVVITIWVFSWARSTEFHSCASNLTTYVLRYSVNGLHVCLVLEPSCLWICPILTLTLSRIIQKLLGMLLKDSCFKNIHLVMLLKDIQHDHSTKQQYLPYSVNILKILSLPVVLLSIERCNQFSSLMMII